DRPDRLSGHSVKHVEKALLAGLRNSLALAAVYSDIRQNGRCRNVHIPEGMVYELEVPPALASLQIDAYQAFSKKIVSRPMATIEICSRTLNGQVNQAEYFIDGDLGPDSRVAGVLCRAVQPGVITKLSLFGDGVKNP